MSVCYQGTWNMWPQTLSSKWPSHPPGNGTLPGCRVPAKHLFFPWTIALRGIHPLLKPMVSGVWNIGGMGPMTMWQRKSVDYDQDSQPLLHWCLKRIKSLAGSGSGYRRLNGLNSTPALATSFTSISEIHHFHELCNIYPSIHSFPSLPIYLSMAYLSIYLSIFLFSYESRRVRM